MKVDANKVRKAGILLQEIEDLVNSAGKAHEAIDPKIRFPRGFINKASWYRVNFPCQSAQIGDNVAYTLQFLDVLRWLLNRTDLGITAKEMVIKYGIVSVVSVMEGMVHDALSASGVKNPPKKLRSAVKRLETQGMISHSLSVSLQNARKKREKIHLHLYEISGPERYAVEDWNLASATLGELASELSAHSRK